MRDMAATNDITTAPRNRFRRLLRLRPWVQTAFLGVWLAPVGRWLHSVPACVFHCYACPLSSMACPVGVVANFAAWGAFPLLVVGMLLFVAAMVGSLVCGWACPFGFLQDLAGRIPVRKFRIPNWLGYGRYMVLIGLVVLVPYLWGENHPLFICRVCPAGGLEAGIPRTIMGMTVPGHPQVWLSGTKAVILVAFLAAVVFTYRPWCKVFCPLGGFLALFNRVSLFHIRFSSTDCTECNTCRSRCMMGVKVDKAVNTPGCVRCLECVSCGAFKPALGAQKKPARRSA